MACFNIWRFPRGRIQDSYPYKEVNTQYLHRQIKDLQPGDHLCLIYETEAEHRAVLTPFLRQGLESGDKVIYFVDACTGETVLGYLKDDGVDADAYMQRGQLVILEADAVYIREGAFDPDSMIQLLRSETDRALAEGYRALRVSGETSWALKGLPESKRLIEYEAKLNNFFSISQCLAICQYDRRRFPPDILMEVLATHPTAVIGVEVIDNIYYLPPEDLLGPDPDSARLANWVENLQNRQRIEKALQSQAIRSDKRLHCFYGIAELAETPGTSLSVLLRRVIDLIPPAWQYPEVTCAAISLEGEEYKTNNFRETPWKLVSAIKVEGREAGRLQVHYLEESPQADEGPFQGEERHLIDAIAERLGLIIERLRAAEQRSAVSAYARSLIEASLDPLVTISPEGKITDVNRATEEATGIDRATLIGRDFSDYFTETDKARAGYQQVLARGFVRDYPLALRHASGRLMDVLYNATTYTNEAGEVQGVFAAARDVTERKKIEEALRATSLYARSLIEASLDPLVTISQEGKITDVNRATEEATGIDRATLIGRDFSDYFSEPHKAREGYQQILAQGFVRDYPLVLRHASGRLMDVLYNATTYINEAGEVQGVFAAARDVTERKKIEEALRASEKKFRLAFENAQDAILWADAQTGVLIHCNQAAEELFETTREKIYGKHHTILHPPEEADFYRKMFREHRELRDGGKEAKILTKSGKMKTVTISASVTEVAGKKVIQGIFRNISARKQAEEALRLYRNRLETLVQERTCNLNEVIEHLEKEMAERRRVEQDLIQAELKYRIVADFAFDWEYWMNPDGTLRYVSPSCKRISGYPAEQFLKHPRLIREIILPEDREIWAQHEVGADHPGQPMLFRIQRPDGEVRWIEHVCVRVVGDDGIDLGIRATNRDATQRLEAGIHAKQLQEELYHAMRVATMGELAASLAHELNQPLNATLNNAQAALRFLKKNRPPKEEVRGALLDIVQDVGRASMVIKQLRRTLKPGVTEEGPVNLNKVVREAYAFIRTESSTRGIHVEFQLTNNLPLVWGDRVQLLQVVLNLLINSLEAIKEITAYPGHMVVKTFVESGWVTLAVQDNGKGVALADRERLFEPFFTTKPEGLGMGLAICRSIIESHAGHLTFTPNPDRGTAFSFGLPIKEAS